MLAEFPSRRPQGYIDQRLRYAERCGVREIRGQEAENAFKNRHVRLLCQTPPLSESAARISSVDPRSEIFPFPLGASPGSELQENMDEQSDSVRYNHLDK